ncbi:hypothetical protein Pmani_013372 [Petrolisthes manimaculis]|uniref:Cuticle protein n=1 Tax=Petrolisthes manimaculis TaxID=1843537 RepID=A0AAE1UC97_9EUCA|nr:hypothetical protein Pmani_013372 [Petrolisthes manimaculis]
MEGYEGEVKEVLACALFVLLVVVSEGRPQSYDYQPPQQSYLAPQPSDRVDRVTVAPQPPMEGMPYDFTWGVDDTNSGNSFSHVENSDGQTTQGEYRVLLPDGRTQVVKFFDNGDGYNAEVTYEK